VGQGPTFQGVYDLRRRQLLRFERTAHNARRAPVTVGDLHAGALEAHLGAPAVRQLREDVALVAGAGAPFDRDAFLAGKVTPVLFGSALTSFGVEPLLDALLELAPPPGPRPSDREPILPTDERFSGVVFKIQANMDPLHRDRMAFLRVCSGRFRKDMLVHHARLGQRIRMTRPHRLFARDREVLEEAFPGDVVGVVNPGLFVIGDTVSSGAPVRFDAIPRFPPECFAVLHNRTLAKAKQFHRGLRQLEEEGAIQVWLAAERTRREFVLAAVGELQFDVAAARLAAEYGVQTHVERLPHVAARYVVGEPAALGRILWPYAGVVRAEDREGRQVVLFHSLRDIAYCMEKNPEVAFRPVGETR
jgi:peptide chain release factor 3